MLESASQLVTNSGNYAEGEKGSVYGEEGGSAYGEERRANAEPQS